MAQTSAFITPEALLAHWQGHRRLTRRVIVTFPDDKLFTFSIGGMRPFGAFAMEFLTMAVPMVRGALTGEWNAPMDRDPRPKSEILRLWDEGTTQLNQLWPQIPRERFHETLMAFGQYPGVLHDLILNVIDNEIHHRGVLKLTSARVRKSQVRRTEVQECQDDDRGAPCTGAHAVASGDLSLRQQHDRRRDQERQADQ